MNDMVRNLQIAFSAACGIVCLLLIVLWMRSYYWYDGAFTSPPNGKSYGLSSFEGRIDGYVWQTGSWNLADLVSGWTVESVTREQYGRLDMGMGRSSDTWGFGGVPHEGGALVMAPHWFLATLAGVFTLAPWIPWSRRFSMRTLLMIITLAAVLLGVIVYAIR
jgi:hypothetical protein